MNQNKNLARHYDFYDLGGTSLEQNGTILMANREIEIRKHGRAETQQPIKEINTNQPELPIAIGIHPFPWWNKTEQKHYTRHYEEVFGSSNTDVVISPRLGQKIYYLEIARLPSHDGSS